MAELAAGAAAALAQASSAVLALPAAALASSSQVAAVTDTGTHVASPATVSFLGDDAHMHEAHDHLSLVRLRRHLAPPPPPFEATATTVHRALFTNAPSCLLLPAGVVSDIVQRINSFEPLRVLAAWYACEPSFTYTQIVTLLSRRMAFELLFGLSTFSMGTEESALSPVVAPLAFRLLVHLSMMQKSRNARCRPLLIMALSVVDYLFGHCTTISQTLRSALRLGLSRSFVAPFLSDHAELVDFPFGDAYFGVVDNFDFTLTATESAGGRPVHRSVILEICMPLPTLILMDLRAQLRANKGSWLAHEPPVGARNRERFFRSHLCFRSDSPMFSFIGWVAQNILNSSTARAVAVSDAERVRQPRLGYHVLSKSSAAARPFLRPPFMEWSSNTAAHVAALGFSLHRQHVRPQHPLHIVVCDCQIYLSLWQRCDEARAAGIRDLSSLFPVPGLWHLGWNFLECVFRWCWDWLLGPAAVVLGWRRPNRECSDFDACERLLEVVTYAIVRHFRSHYGHESILRVVDTLEAHDRPSHYLLFIYVHLFSPFFELRAQIRARNFTNTIDLMKFMLPTFYASNHRNYCALVARFVISFELALPAVQSAVLHSLAAALTPGPLKGEANDMTLERTNGDLKELIDDVRTEETRVERLLRVYNLGIVVRHAVEQHVGGGSELNAERDRDNDDDDGAGAVTGGRDDAGNARDIHTLGAWLDERLGWNGVACSQWHARALRDVPLQHVFATDACERRVLVSSSRDVVQHLNRADDGVKHWLGGAVRDSGVWMHHEWQHDESANEPARTDDS